MTMKMTLTVHCDECDAETSKPFEDEEVFDGTELGDEHGTDDGLTFVNNYHGCARVYLCDDCFADHEEDREQHARETGDN